MNKTEKLLAARRKLKEFQLHKSNHEQEVVTNQANTQHHEKIVPKNLDNNGLSRENECSSNSDGRNSENNNEPQPHWDTNISNNVCITEETKSAESLISLDEEKSRNIIESQDTSSRIIEENLEASLVNDQSIFLENPNLEENFSSHKPEVDIFGMMESSNSNKGCNNFKSVEMETVGNGNDLFDSAIITENSVHTIPPLNPIVFCDNDNKSKFFNTTNTELEHENKSLIANLETENDTIQQLQLELSQCHNRISELENFLAHKNTEQNNEFTYHVNALQEQIQMHRQATEILVAEKADLSVALSQYQSVAQQKASEVSELYEKLKSTVAKMAEMEKDLATVKINSEDSKNSREKLLKDIEELKEQNLELKKVKEEQDYETSELRQELSMKRNELTNLQQKMEENQNLLSLAEIKIQQLTIEPQHFQTIESQHETQTLLKQQISQLQENLKAVEKEKVEKCQYYESYVNQLNVKYDGVAQEMESAQKRIAEYIEREESLIQRLSLMEQHYQREKQKVETLLPLQAHEEKITHLTKSMDSLVLENENLQRTLHEKEAEAESIKEELQELRELRDQSVETSKLVTALEGEQLGASRAVSQNQQLKLQLSEMHDAFVLLSNSKLNLTEQLQDERTVGRKLNSEYSRLEAERDELKEELNRKNEVIDELEKDKLHYTQIADQVQHYQVQSNQTRTLQQEIQNSMSIIEMLKNENQSLNRKLNNLTKNSSEENNDPNLSNGVIETTTTATQCITDQGEEASESLQLEKDSCDTMLIESHQKLESRFKDTMERVAELTDEKQRLEHLVLQLQGETETIGEYITLYQKQRAILQMKGQERERIFSQLLDERNRQQAQLHQLKILIAELLKIDEHSPNELKIQQFLTPNVIQEDKPQTDKTVNEETGVETVEAPQVVEPVKIKDVKTETTSKILELLTDINDCKGVCSSEPNIDHCLWCSGKLITV